MRVTHPPMDEDTHPHGEYENIVSQSNGIGHPLFHASEIPLASDADPSGVSDSGYDGDSEASSDEDNTEAYQSLSSAEPDSNETSVITISTAKITLNPPRLLSHEQHNINSGPVEHVAQDHSLSADVGSEADIEDLSADVCKPNGFHWSEDHIL